MLKNPDHKEILELARHMLHTLEHCPDGLQKVRNDLLPLARFCNGMYAPNSQRPNAVYVELDGETWRFQRGKKSWRRV
jgi:hypothetical protein